MTPDEIAAALRAILAARLPAYGFGTLDPVIPLAQAAHETGGFTSSLLIDGSNNAFGMKVPHSRPFVGFGSGIYDSDGSEFAAYPSIRESVEDYLIRQRVFDIDEAYAADPRAITYMTATFASGYATDPAYLEKWSAWVQRLGGDPPVPPQVAGSSSIAVLVLAALALSLVR